MMELPTLIHRPDTEFTDKEFNEFKYDAYKKLRSIEERIIKERSPLQIGDKVEIPLSRDNTQLVEVYNVVLCAVSSFGYPGDRLSFTYHGYPLRKDGKRMLNRKEISFNSFIKDGKRVSMPSYYRVMVRCNEIKFGPRIG